MMCCLVRLSSLGRMARAQPTQLRSRERVEAVFEATRVLLREGGIERCTVAAIAAQANITPASLYRYFPDATSIVRELAEASLDEVHHELRELLATIHDADDVRAVMEVALERYVELFTSDRALRELWFGSLADPQLVALNVADSRRNGVLIAETIAPYVDIPIGDLRDRWFLLSHMIGAAVGLIIEVSPREAKRLKRQLNGLTLLSFSTPLR
jgi:AcrR family transcriptional regulator